jgi:hypothetical protein
MRILFHSLAFYTKYFDRFITLMRNVMRLNQMIFSNDELFMSVIKQFKSFFSILKTTDKVLNPR